MTDEQAAKILDEMREMFSTPLPNPEHEPVRFAYYVKLYKYYKARENEGQQI
jgi:hypothetical protein